MCYDGCVLCFISAVHQIHDYILGHRLLIPDTKGTKPNTKINQKFWGYLD
jgi:hypothetical protein